MDFIKRKAIDFIDRYIAGMISAHTDVISALKSDMNEIDDERDRISYITLILERSNQDYVAHKRICEDPEHCSDSYSYEALSYYITQELRKLGVGINTDTFTQEDKVSVEAKINQILEDLKSLKAGQQVIYEDLAKEFEELKELYFLGKKKWFQLFLGKSVEMVASGMVSDTFSKQMVQEAKDALPGLLGN